LRCPACGHATEVLETRLAGVGQVVRRRRQCRCGNRFSTRETVIAEAVPEVKAPAALEGAAPVVKPKPRRDRYDFNPFDEDENFLPEG